ncbi:hypothetical protein [Paenibacillus sp. S150]|uniref:hypothetical protein n=1 Tax=Paenibacillus sp. S150 TaxID=2749826 RepID=UPI001C564F25|nr:hypothetical protein [Paenibacillus sp. S150]MBW4083544.1 hypothetical protein [Paenibacillus sp. S150]
MGNLKEFIVPYSIPNIIIMNISTKKKIILYAVSSSGRSVVVGPVESEYDRGWLNRCWEISKEELLENYSL